MVEKRYDWNEGARLEEHSHRKHRILREYFFDYLTVRCRLPQQERFRLAIVDGFAGGGRYQCGTAGSPLIFIEELQRAIDSVNSQRTVQGLNAIEIECLLVLNDESTVAIELLKTNVAPVQINVPQSTPKLHLRVEYLNEPFESAYPKIKVLLERGRYRSVIFNLDQCGHSHVERTTIIDIMRSYPSAEIFYTFMISSLLAFLQKTEPERLKTQLAYLDLSQADLQILDSSIVGNNTWLGTAERIVFDAFRMCAPFVSPFSINNPNGWRYWLIHFANVYRARQVYNNVLHANSSLQAHFGRSGLHMLSYDPSHEGKLYLFDMSGRASAKNQLAQDIPQLVMESGDAMPVSDFYESVYNVTPAHTDDVHSAIIESPDLEVITPSGGRRRKANTIDVNDVLKIKTQRSFFPLFLNANVTGRK